MSPEESASWIASIIEDLKIIRSDLNFLRNDGRQIFQISDVNPLATRSEALVEKMIAFQHQMLGTGKEPMRLDEVSQI